MHWVKCQTVTTYTIAFDLPWINDALSHLMYQESGYLWRTSFEIEEIGSSRVDPALTAREKQQMA